MYKMDSLAWSLLVVCAFIVITLLTYGTIQYLIEFTRELRYLNSEISRTNGPERKYWKRERRRLWFSLIPFVRY